MSWRRSIREWDNYGDNALAFFKPFRHVEDATSPLVVKGRGCRGIERGER